MRDVMHSSGAILRPIADAQVPQLRRNAARPLPTDKYASLTTRQRQLLLLAAEGWTNPRIAKHLSISVRTVESHRADFMRKLGLRHQTDLVRYALRHGLLPIVTQEQ
jgi:DNA-binding NarL/FixJ family response regulator